MLRGFSFSVGESTCTYLMQRGNHAASTQSHNHTSQHQTEASATAPCSILCVCSEPVLPAAISDMRAGQHCIFKAVLVSPARRAAERRTLGTTPASLVAPWRDSARAQQLPLQTEHDVSITKRHHRITSSSSDSHVMQLRNATACLPACLHACMPGRVCSHVDPV